MPFTPVFLTGKFHGPKSLVGYSPWGQKESDMTEHTGNLALKASEGRWAPVAAHLMSFTESPRSSALSCSKFQLLASFASTVPPPNIPSSFIILQQVHSTSPRTTGVSLGSRAPALHTKEERAQAHLQDHQLGHQVACRGGETGGKDFRNEIQESVLGSGRVASSLPITETWLV